MAYRRSLVALPAALLTGLQLGALGEEENSTTSVRSLRGSNGKSVSFECKSNGALCGSNGMPSALCCSGLTCQPLLGSFEMRCGDKPSPKPVPTPRPTPQPTPRPRNQCREIGCGSQGKRGDECECIEECLLRGTCCSDFYSICKSGPRPTLPPQPTPAPGPAPTPAPTPYIPPYVDGDYLVYIDKNAYEPYGAIDIDTDATAAAGLTVSQCQSRCTTDAECMCVTQRRSDGTCWRRKACDASQWTSDWNAGYDVYVKRAAPTPAPYSPQPGQTYLQWNHDPSYCMSVDNNVFQNGQKMQLWKCAGGSGQYFEFDTLSPGLLRASAAPEYCVVIDGNNDSNGAKIQLWECEMNELAQYWTREWTCPSYVPAYACAEPAEPETRVARGDFALIRNTKFPDKCLVVDLPDMNVENGQQLQLWSCDDVQQYKTWRHGL